jgi:hypothetical protein
MAKVGVGDINRRKHEGEQHPPKKYDSIAAQLPAGGFPPCIIHSQGCGNFI